MNVDGLEAFLELGVAVAPHVAKRVPAAARYVSAEYRFEFLHGSHAHHVESTNGCNPPPLKPRSWTSRPTRTSTPVTTTALLTKTARGTKHPRFVAGRVSIIGPLPQEASDGQRGRIPLSPGEKGRPWTDGDRLRL